MIQSTAKCKIFLFLVLLQLRLSVAQLLWESYCSQDKEIINSSPLERNLEVVRNSLVENVNKTGYNISWYGQNGDKIYGLAQCRGDLNVSACRTCASDARRVLRENCHNISGSILYVVEGCFLKYDTHNFYSKLNFSDPAVIWWCDNVKRSGTVKNPRSLDWGVSNLLTKVMENAVSSNVGYSILSGHGVYSMAQCWRDISMNDCTVCLNTLFNSLGSCPSGTNLGVSMSDNCMIEFSTQKFYSDGVPLLSTPTGNGSGPSIQPSTSPSKENEGKNRPHLSLMLKLTIAGGISIVVVVSAIVIIWKRKDQKQLRLGVYKLSSELSTTISKSKLNYKSQILRIATNNFSLKNKIGQGGFGSVYKGVLQDGREIAVKRLFANREQSVDEFFNEVNLISHVQHKNLVKLLGCSVDSIDRLLVYELGSLSIRGYMAPEYLVHGHLTEKVDVYAFGVLVMEIISGRKNKAPMHIDDMPSLLTLIIYSTLHNLCIF